MRILIIDDHLLFANSLSQALRNMGYEADVGSTDFLSLKRFILVSAPDIVLLDINLSGIDFDDGFALAHNLLVLFPSLKIIFISGYAFPEYFQKAKLSSGMGFLNKSITIQELEFAIESVAKGKQIFSSNPKIQSKGQVRITSRQKEILQLLAEGKSTLEIAQMLIISERTVRNHIQATNEILGTNSYVKSIIKSIELGIVKIDI